MKRRSFLGMMLAGTTAAALGGTAAIGAETRQPDDAKPAAGGPTPDHGPKLSPEAELVGYCGRYCGKCSLCAANVSMSAAALQKFNDTIAIRKSAEQIGFPPIHDLAVHCCTQFDRDLASFVDFAKNKAFPPGCRKGCAPCEVAPCCKGRGYLTCAECADMDKCPKLDKYRGVVGENLKAIRKDGLDKWAKAQHQQTIDLKKAALHKAIDSAF